MRSSAQSSRDRNRRSAVNEPKAAAMVPRKFTASSLVENAWADARTAMPMVSQTLSSMRSSAKRRRPAPPRDRIPAARLSPGTELLPRRDQTPAKRIAAASAARNAQVVSASEPSTLPHAPVRNRADEPAARTLQKTGGFFLKTPARPSAAKAAPAASIQRRKGCASPPRTLDHRPRSSMAHSVKAACCQTIKTRKDKSPDARAATVLPCLNHDKVEMPAMPRKNSRRAEPA